METGRDLLLRRRVWQKIARKLLQRELIKGLVGIEGLDHVIPPGPIRARGIGLKAVRVGVARRIQPPHGHALSEMRRGQQVGDFRFQVCGFRWRWRQTREIKGQPAPQRVLGGFWRELAILFCQSCFHKKIHGMTFRRPFDRLLEGPVLSPLGALGDPAFQRVDLLGAQLGFMRFRRRHDFIWIIRRDARDEVAGLKDLTSALRSVQAEIRFPMSLILPVAGEAVI